MCPSTPRCKAGLFVGPDPELMPRFWGPGGRATPSFPTILVSQDVQMNNQVHIL